MLILQAAKEVVDEEGFDELLDAVRARVDEIEGECSESQSPEHLLSLRARLAPPKRIDRQGAVPRQARRWQLAVWLEATDHRGRRARSVFCTAGRRQGGGRSHIAGGRWMRTSRATVESTKGRLRRALTCCMPPQTIALSAEHRLPCLIHERAFLFAGAPAFSLAAPGAQSPASR